MLHICTLHFDFCKYQSTSKHFLVCVDHCPLRSKQRWVEGFQTRYKSDSGLNLQPKSHFVLIGWMTVLQSNKNYMESPEQMLKDYRYILFTAVFFLIGFLCTSCMMPIHDANDVWRLATPPPSTSSTLFEQWCGFFYVPQEPDKWKCCETGPKVFRPYPRRLERITVRRCHYKGSTFFSVI